MSLPRVLVVSHGHPDLSKGGAEVAAYNLFRGLRDKGAEALFLARVDQPSHGGSTFSARAPNELLFHTGMRDFFNFRIAQAEHAWRDFRDLLERFRPDVIHFHHYVHLGLELISVARATCPSACIAVTLHEYLALCNNNGQMVKTDGTLCHASTPFDCARCFTNHSPADFFLRNQLIKNAFRAVDLFVAPSAFLKDRYVKWGLEEERIVILENGHAAVEPPCPRPLGEHGVRGRFAYFGQMNPYKGIDVLLKAFSMLDEETREVVHLDIYGANLSNQAPEFREPVEALLESLDDVVTMHGPYKHEELGTLMANVDWVVMPSTWWENSPMVIQEAFSYRRPVICADIGGMAEKVSHGVNGIHFRSRSARNLADTVRRASSDEQLWNQLVTGITPPPTVEAITDAHLDRYVFGERRPSTKLRAG